MTGLVWFGLVVRGIGHFRAVAFDLFVESSFRTVNWTSDSDRLLLFGSCFLVWGLGQSLDRIDRPRLPKSSYSELARGLTIYSVSHCLGWQVSALCCLCSKDKAE